MFNNDALDDPLIPDVCTSFAGGMFSDARAGALSDDQCAWLVNMEIARNGHVTTRRGVARLGVGFVEDGSAPYSGGRFIQGLHAFDTPYLNLLVSINNRAFWKYNGTSWVLVPGYLSGVFSFHNLIPVAMVQGDDCLYLADIFSSITQWDGTTFTSLGPSGPDKAPFGASSLAWHTNRLVASAILGEPDTVAFSDILDPQTWDTAFQNISVGRGDGEPISGIFSWTDFNLLVFKRRSIWIVNCDPRGASPPGSASHFPIKPVHQNIGVTAWRTAAHVGSDVLVLTDNFGVRSIRRTLAVSDQQDIGPALSAPIDDLIRRINPAYLHISHATVRRNFYILFVPLDNSATCNYALVYNSLTESWNGYWTGWQPTICASRVGSDGRVRMVFGDALGYVKEFLDYVPEASETLPVYQDDGVNIASSVATRGLDFGDSRSPKTGMNCEVEYSAQPFGGGTTPQVTVYDETGLQRGNSIGLVSSGAVQRAAFDLQSRGQFRELQFQVSSTRGKLSVKRLHAHAFEDTMVLQSA